MTTRGFVYEFGRWGPAYWRVAHSITWLYPESDPTPQQRDRIRVFFELLPDLLPCPLCGSHFRETTATVHPLTDRVLSSRTALTRWLIDVHNEVNRRLGKPTVSYGQAEAYYLRDCGRAPEQHPEAGREVALAVAALALAGLGGVAGFLLARRGDPPAGQAAGPAAA